METAKEQLIKKLKAAGYKNFMLSVWHGMRLYVDIKGEPDFYYELDKAGTRDCRCNVGSYKKLSNRLFNDARKIGYFVWRNRERLKEEITEKVYVFEEDDDV